MPRSDKSILANFTSQVIQEVLAEGDISHANDDWADESIDTNSDHLDKHLNNFLESQYFSVDFLKVEEELRHIVCRASMLYYSWLKENGKI
jgi:hypothetical protein